MNFLELKHQSVEKQVALYTSHKHIRSFPNFEYRWTSLFADFLSAVSLIRGLEICSKIQNSRSLSCLFAILLKFDTKMALKWHCSDIQRSRFYSLRCFHRTYYLPRITRANCISLSVSVS